MIVTINGTDYNVITSWKEVTDVDALLKCETFRHEIKALTDIPDEIVYGCDELQLFPIYTLCSFLHDDDNMPFVECCDIGLKPYWKVEMAKRIATGEGKEYQKAIQIAQVYYPKEKSCIRLVGLGNALTTALWNFLSYYKDMMSEEAEQIEIAAGIDSLSGFGSFGTVLELAQGDVTKIQTIYNMKADRVYSALHYNWRKAKYMEALHKLKHPPKP